LRNTASISNVSYVSINLRKTQETGKREERRKKRGLERRQGGGMNQTRYEKQSMT
jgi:hypothetical protein